MNTTEPHIIIDEERNIYVPDELQRIAVQYDHNIETVTFDCPRYWDGHDLSAMAIYISYMRPDNELGTYIAEKVRIDSEDDSIFHFDWTITNFLTAIDGKIRFIVCVKKVDAEGNETQHWNSELNTEMYVSQGLDCSSELSDVADTYPDIITQLINNTCSKYEIETMLTTKADADKVYTKAEVDELTKVDDQLSTLSSSTRPVQNNVVSKAISDDRVRIESCEDSIDEIKSSKGYVPIRYVEGTKDFNTDFMLSSTDPDKVVFSNSDKTVQINSPFASDLFPYLLVVERVKFGVTETAYDLRQTCITVKNAGSESVEFVEHQRIYMGGPNPIWTAWKQRENSGTDNVYTKAEVDALIPEIDDKLNAASTNPVQNKAITTTLYGVSSQATQLQSKIANMYTKAEVDALTKVDDQLSTLSSSTRPVQNNVVSKAISDDRVRIESCEDSIDDLKETVTSQGNTITWLNNNKANSSTVNALQTSVTNIGNTVTTHNIRITKVEQSTANMYTKAEVDTKISTLQTKTDNMYTKAEVDELTKVDDQLSTLSSSTRPVQNNVVSKAISDDRVRIESCEDSIANMYTKAEVDALIPEIDDELNATSTNPVQNQAITLTLYSVSSQATQLQSKVANMYTKAEVDALIPEIDDELNAASHNPVENQVIYNEISTLHREVSQNGDDIGIHDNEITVLNNQVTSLSKGLSATVTTANTAKTNSATALEGVTLNKSTLGYQKKNLLKNEAITQTKNGVTFTVNSDGSVTVNGTATADAVFYLTDYQKLIYGTKYILSGCPEGGSSDKYRLYIMSRTDWSLTAADAGDSTTFTASDSEYFTVRLTVYSGITVNNLVFKPMIRYADITDDTYEPYVDDVDTRIVNNDVDIAINKSTLGYQKKNLFDWKNATVVNSNDSVIVSKTDTSITVTSQKRWARVACKLPSLEVGKRYTFSTLISDLSIDSSAGKKTVRIFLAYDVEGINHIDAHTYINTNQKYTITFTPTSSTVYLFLYPNFSEPVYTNSFTASEIMLRYADITDDTYEPYVESVDERLNTLLARIEALENA